MKKIDKINIDVISDYANGCFEELIDYIRYKKLDTNKDDKLMQFYEKYIKFNKYFCFKS